MTIIIFVLYILAHVFLFAMCASAAHGDREASKWMRDWRDGR